MVNSRKEAESVVRAVRYAPEGSRSWGPSLVGMRVKDNFEYAHKTNAVIPVIDYMNMLYLMSSNSLYSFNSVYSNLDLN